MPSIACIIPFFRIAEPVWLAWSDNRDAHKVGAPLGAELLHIFQCRIVVHLSWLPVWAKSNLHVGCLALLLLPCWRGWYQPRCVSTCEPSRLIGWSSLEFFCCYRYTIPWYSFLCLQAPIPWNCHHHGVRVKLSTSALSSSPVRVSREVVDVTLIVVTLGTQNIIAKCIDQPIGTRTRDS